MKWVFIESISLKASTFVLSLVLSRLLMPSDFGTLAIINVFYLIATIVVEAGLNEALIQKKDASNDDYSTMFWSNLFLAIIFYFILFFIAPYIELYCKIADLSFYIRIQAITLIISSFSFVQVVKATKELNLKKITVSRIPATIISFVIGIGLAYFGYGIMALILQQILNILIYTILLTINVKYKIQFIFDKESFKELFSFGMKILSITFISRVQAQLMNLSFGYFYGIKDLGLYSRAKSLQSIPTDIVNTTFTKGMYPSVVKIQQKDYMLRKLFKINLKFLLIVTFFINFIFFFESNSIISFLLGKNWVEMNVYIKVIVLGTFLEPINYQVINIYKAKGLLKNLLKYETIIKIATTSIVLICPFFFSFITVISIVVFVNNLFSIIYLYNCSKLIKLSFYEEMKVILFMFLYMLIIGYLIHCFIAIFADKINLLFELSLYGLFYLLFTILLISFSKEFGLKKFILKKNRL